MMSNGYKASKALRTPKASLKGASQRSIISNIEAPYLPAVQASYRHAQPICWVLYTM